MDSVLVCSLALIWDADGVLFDTFLPDGGFRWSKDIEPDLGLGPLVLKDIFRGGWHDVIRGTRQEIAHVREVFARHNVSVSAEDFLDYWLEKDRNINESVASYLPLFESHIGSNQSPLRAEKFEVWFKGRIGSVFASSRMGTQKPEAAYYAFIEKALNRASSALCLIDDTEENVLAARARGWLGHHFTGLEGLDSFLRQRIQPSSH